MERIVPTKNEKEITTMEEMMETVQTPMEEDLECVEDTDPETKGGGLGFVAGALVGAGVVIAGKFVYRKVIKPAAAWCKERKRRTKTVVVDVSDAPEEDIDD